LFGGTTSGKEGRRTAVLLAPKGYFGATVRQDPAGNIKPDKEKSVEKIDGIVAAIMALDRSIRNKGDTSVYDGRGILIL
jgi:hypothetical protein